MAIRRKPLLPVVLLAAAAAAWMPLVVTYASEFIAVDRCLDSGGSYDYRRHTCDHERNHPHLAFATRHPRLIAAIPAAAIASGVLVVGALLMFVSRTSRRNAG